MFSFGNGGWSFVRLCVQATATWAVQQAEGVNLSEEAVLSQLEV